MVTIAECRNGMKTFFKSYWRFSWKKWHTVLLNHNHADILNHSRSKNAGFGGFGANRKAHQLRQLEEQAHTEAGGWVKNDFFAVYKKKLTAESRVKEADFKAAPFPSTFSRYRMLHGWSTINTDTTEEGDGMGPYHYGDHGVHGGGGHETNGFSVGDTLQNKTNKGYIQETSGRLRYVEVCMCCRWVHTERDI